MNLTTIQIPGGVPYIEQYLGAWIMHEPIFRAKLEMLQQMNISLHLQNVRGDPAGEQEQAERRKTAGGYGYDVTEDGIAVMELRGSLMKQQTSADDGTSTVRVRRDVRAAMGDPAVRGVLVVIDSPGGTVAGAYDLADDLWALSQK